jgi:GT2 family glycosyltransferase
MSKKIVAIIVTYNGIKWIEKCFQSLQNSLLPISIIVIDNGSTDGTLESIKNNFPNIQLIQSEKNLGFGMANNIGIKKSYEAGADYVFLINQDVWIQEDTIQKLVLISNENPEFGIISPIHLNGNGDALDNGFSNYIVPKKCEAIYSDAFLNKIKDQVYPLDFVNAAAWLISRECIEKVGGFSPSFFHYGEDDNYCQRILYHNLKIGIYPNAIIFHDRDQRPKNKFFTNTFLFYKRKIVSEFSNPNSNKKKRSFYKSEIKGFYICLLTLDFNKMKSYIHNIKVLYSIDFNFIQKNKELTTRKGATFLND